MKQFRRPEIKVVVNDELSEGIYMNSGDTWSVTYRPQDPRGACYMDGSEPKCTYHIDGYHLDGTQSNSTTFKFTFSKTLTDAMVNALLNGSLNTREYAVVGDTIYYYFENRSWSQFGMGEPIYSYNPVEGEIVITAFSVTDGKADVPWISRW